MILPQYDFVIFGDHPAALWSALVALECGFKVLLIPMGDTRKRTLLPKFVLKQFELEIPKPVDEIQIIAPDRKFRVFQDPSKWDFEHEFCFGRLMNPVTGPRADIRRGFAYLYRGGETAPSVSQSWSEIARRVADSQFQLEWGSELVQKVLDVIIKNGGTVLAPNSLARIFVEQKKLIGVQLHGHSDIIRTEQGIFSASLSLLQPLLNVDGDSDKRNRAVLPLAWNFEVQIQVSPESTPSGLSSRMIYVQRNAPIVDIFHTVQRDHADTFRLRTTLPFDATSLKRSEQRRITQRLVKLMSDLIPDFAYNLKQVTPEMRDQERAETVELPQLYPFETLDQIPPSLLVYGTPGVGSKTEIRGLDLAGDESDPSLGEWGAYSCVQSIFQSWLKKSDKAEIPRRQPLIDAVAHHVNK